MSNPSEINTLRFDSETCTGCGMCSSVCPHGVYTQNGRATLLVRPEACMECGACRLNCPAGAITVDSGVGCAFALMRQALLGEKEAICGCSDEPSCC